MPSWPTHRFRTRPSTETLRPRTGDRPLWPLSVGSGHTGYSWLKIGWQYAFPDISSRSLIQRLTVRRGCSTQRRMSHTFHIRMMNKENQAQRAEREGLIECAVGIHVARPAALESQPAYQRSSIPVGLTLPTPIKSLLAARNAWSGPTAVQALRKTPRTDPPRLAICCGSPVYRSEWAEPACSCFPHCCMAMQACGCCPH